MLTELERKLGATPKEIRKIFSGIAVPPLAAGITVILLVWALGLLFALQGWRSSVPAFDMITYFKSVDDFLTRGVMPHFGDVDSYASFHPPATAWLMLPGRLIFTDPRLFEKVGSAALYLGTLLGLFLLARQYFGLWCACLAVILYGLSGFGLFIAGSLWPVGHPFFYIWMIYLGSRWIIQNDPKYLFAAMVVWIFGMYVGMAIAPAIFVLPVLWLIFRPPAPVWSFVSAFAVFLVVWFPYLQFEVPRGFVDIESQVMRQSVSPVNYRDAWCNPNLIMQDLNGPARTLVQNTIGTSGLASRIYHFSGLLLLQGNRVADGLLSNYQETAAFPGASLVLLLMTLCSLIILGINGFPAKTFEAVSRNRIWRSWLTPLGIILLLAGLLANELVIARILKTGNGLPASTLESIHWLQASLLLSAAILLLRGKIMTFLAKPDNEPDPQSQKQMKIFVLGLAVPWLILLIVAEPGRTERYWWLWPMQVLFLAVFVVRILPMLRASPLILGASQALLILTLVFNQILPRLEAWHRSGWAGPDAAQVQLVDYIAGQLHSEGKDHAAIGYNLFFYPFMAADHLINPQYKVGAEFDLLFKYRQGISNKNQCAEGFSPQDEYRVVQTKPETNPEGPRSYFNVPMDNHYQLIRQFGSYQVYRRQYGQGN